MNNRIGITTVELKNRINDSKTILHSIQILQDTPEVTSYMKYLHEKAVKEYYFPFHTLEFIYFKLLHEPQRHLYDMFIRKSEDFIVYLTDSENNLYTFYSRENTSSEYFNFSDKKDSIYA
ncbi:MAG: hypothetical protein MUC49_22330 [Raineya sp.]|jgi:hypothetical protein|nr:hypothetical protein [Raineya sp.]